MRGMVESSKRWVNASADHARKITQPDTVPHRCVTRDALTSKGNGIKAAEPQQSLRQQERGLLASTTMISPSSTSSGEMVAAVRLASTVALSGTNIHELAIDFSTVIGSKVFKDLSYLEKQHDKRRPAEHRENR